MGREWDIVDSWEVGKNRSVWVLDGLAGLSQVVVAEVVVGMFVGIRGFWECQGVGCLGFVTWGEQVRWIRGVSGRVLPGLAGALWEYMTGAVGIMGNTVITASN